MDFLEKDNKRLNRIGLLISLAHLFVLVNLAAEFAFYAPVV